MTPGSRRLKKSEYSASLFKLQHIELVRQHLHQYRRDPLCYTISENN